jgi:carbamoylphosphate synthase small subunit
MSKLKVRVVGDNFGVSSMFIKRGYEVMINDIFSKPDLFVFTGGEDITPKFYGEKSLPGTRSNESRDIREFKIFNTHEKVPKVGICRGGQFLNVANGGEMWQHVNKHGSSHRLINLLPAKKRIQGEELLVTSTHHQMMIPSEDAEIIGIAMNDTKTGGLATEYVSASERERPKFDTEIVWYEKTNSLCFQPHPEYLPKSSLEDYFFELVEHFFH